MIGMAQGLKYSIEQGVTHRDIKGTNILISNTGDAKLVDFGLATIEGDENKPGVKSQRTVDYSAPGADLQQPQGRPSLRHLLPRLRLLPDGDRPAPDGGGREQGHAQEDAQAVLRRDQADQRASATPPTRSSCAIIEKMMKIDLKARYQTMDDVVADLEQYKASLARPAIRPATAAKPRRTTTSSLDLRPAAGAATEPAAGGARRAAAGQGRAVKSILCVEAQDEIQDALRKTLDGWATGCCWSRDAETRRRAVSRVPDRRRDLRRRRPGRRAIDALHRHAREGPRGRASARRPGAPGPQQGSCGRSCPPTTG